MYNRHLKTSAAGLDMIKRHEGFSANAYRCPAHLWTIGYGHVILPHERTLLECREISHDEALRLLVKDTEHAERAIHRAVEAPLEQHQFDALVSLVFNIGVDAFKDSTLCAMLNADQHAAAANQFERWIYAKKRMIPGLVKRRAAEKALFTGTQGKA
jgi:lysozyme